MPTRPPRPRLLLQELGYLVSSYPKKACLFMLPSRFTIHNLTFFSFVLICLKAYTASLYLFLCNFLYNFTGVPSELIEDSKFVPLNADDLIYGPPVSCGQFHSNYDKCYLPMFLLQKIAQNREKSLLQDLIVMRFLFAFII